MTVITSRQRFTAKHPCPICDGYDGQQRGVGKRCYGFLSDDGLWAHCTRSEHAGRLTAHDESQTYAHRLSRDCKCGMPHDRSSPAAANGHQWEIESTYPYRDETGTLLFEVVRFVGKDFRQRRPVGTGGWEWNLDGVKRVLYRLPELLAADPEKLVYVVEGEKDADNLRALGMVATTNAGGAKKWRQEYTKPLRGRHVAILPDNDEDGCTHAEQVAQMLKDGAASVRIVRLPNLPPKGDVSDWLRAGGTAEQLAASVEETSIISDDNQPNRANRERKVFQFTRLADLLAEPAEVADYVIDGLLIAGGVSILGAKPKVGKSTLARNAALCVARGTLFMDRPTVRGPVVYLALEEKRSEVARHFANMGATAEPIMIHVGSAPEDALEELRAAIDMHRPVLAIIDPLFKLVRLRDGNDYTEVSRALEPLIDLARATGCHLLCAHHLGKGERSGGDAVLGSTALFGAVDTLLLMKRSSEGARTIETIQRYGDDLPATVVKLDSETGIITAAGDVATLKLEETTAAILKALGNETLPEAEIRERVGGNESLVAKGLRKLVDHGRVTRSGSGKRGDPFYYTAVQMTANEAADESENTRFSRLALYGNQETEQTEKRDASTAPLESGHAALVRVHTAIKKHDFATACTVMRDFPSIDWTPERALIEQSQPVTRDAP